MSEYVCSCCQKKCESDGILFTPSRVAYRCTSCRKIVCSKCATGLIVKDCCLCGTSEGEGFDKL